MVAWAGGATTRWQRDFRQGVLRRKLFPTQSFHMVDGVILQDDLVIPFEVGTFAEFHRSVYELKVK